MTQRETGDKRKEAELVYEKTMDAGDNRVAMLIVKNLINKKVGGFENLNREWYTCYVGFVPGNDLYEPLRIEPQGRIPVEVHGGFTYSGDSPPGGIEPELPANQQCELWLGWDYNHGYDQESKISLTDVQTDLIEAANQFRELTLQEWAEEKLDREPDWYVQELENIF